MVRAFASFALGWVAWISSGCARAPSEPASAPESSASGPSPLAVCEHLADVVASELGVEVEPSVRASTVETCVGDMTTQAQGRGPEAWAQIGECVLAAEDSEEIDACDQRFPVTAAASDREDEACVTMVALILIDAEAAGEVVIDALSDAEFDVLEQECASALASERATMSDGEYQAYLDCVLSCTEADELGACGPQG